MGWVTRLHTPNPSTEAAVAAAVAAAAVDEDY